MKRTIRVLALIMLASTVLSLVACANVSTQLSAPTNIRVNDGVVMWNPVEGAVGYVVSVNGYEYTVVTASYDLSGCSDISVGDSCTVKVKAQGDGYIKLSSNFSKAYEFVYEDAETGSSGTQTGGNQSGETQTGGNVAIVKTAENGFYIPHSASYTTPVDKCTDGVYNYYLYYIGYLENFPLVYSTTKYHVPPGSYSYSETITEESQTAIQSSVSNSVSVTVSKSLTLDRGMEVGNDGLLVKGHINIEECWSGAISKTNEVTHSVAESWAKSTSKTLQQSFSADEPAGYYRYVQYTKKCDVYVLVAYDLEEKTFSYDYLSYADSGIKSMVEMIEYSTDGNFNSDREVKLSFDEAVIERINLNETLVNRTPAIEAPSSPITLSGTRYYCKTDNGYNPNESGNAADAGDHDLFELGHIVLYGCKANNLTYTVTDPDAFKLEYVFDQDPQKLPNATNNELYVSNDTYTSVWGTDIQSQQIGLGAYFVKVTYKDGSTATTTSKTNFTQDKYAGAVESLLDGTDFDLSRVAKIEITVVYELYFYASWFDHHHTNWRCDYVIVFA